ncbi:hypothetical protein EVAR_99445_1 [Eumeta japonica]|uniref:Uncharacterized protein n=1 Tax=Eumeta variegata TaxID=151549 RepID=A0A4C2A216_EUMVA|nr:hypothetical protein EVAR_99445_1 [Eumeta japonica]
MRISRIPRSGDRYRSISVGNYLMSKQFAGRSGGRGRRRHGAVGAAAPQPTATIRDARFNSKLRPRPPEVEQTDWVYTCPAVCYDSGRRDETPPAYLTSVRQTDEI